MPWHIGSSDSCPASKPYAVIKDSDGSVVGCHPTKAAAQKQLAALYANENSAGAAHMKPEDLAGVPPARLPFPVTRAVAVPVEARAENGAMPTMTGHFSTFGDWYEVDSWIEGHFLESVGRRAFDKTIDESRSTMKVLYDHGQDPQIGNKILGPIADLRTDRVGPKYEVPLFDTSYNRDLAPGLEAGVYGSSFRFTVEKDVWDHSPARSDYNPEGIPERTITEARVYEFGPVTFPANPKATASARSTTDTFYQRSRDPEQFEALLRSAQVARTPVRAGAADTSEEPPAGTPEEPPEPDTPRIEPPPDEPAPTPKDPPEGGSSDSKEKNSVATEYATPEERESRITELKEVITRRATAYPGELPDEEQNADDRDNAELDDLLRAKAAYEKRQARVAELAGNKANEDEARDQRGKPYSVPNVAPKSRDPFSFEKRGWSSVEERDMEWRDDALRISDITTFPHPGTDVDATRARIAQILDYHDSPDREFARRVKATGSPLYKRAFEKIVAARGTMMLSPEEMRGTALAVGVDGTGGFTVPFAFDPTVIAIGVHNGAVNPYRRACRVVPIVGTDTWNALTATVVVATRATEAAAAVEQGPTFAQPQYVVKRVQGQITMSHEIAQDRADLASEMAVLIQEAKDNEEEGSFAIGVGTTVFPLGVGPVNGTSGAYTGITTATSVTLAAADADATEAALPVRHRFNAQWFMNRTSIRRFQSLETTGGKLFGGSQYPAVGNPAVDGAGNTGLRLLGYPVNESPSFPTAQTALITIASLINVNSYVIVDRIGMSIKFIPFLFNSSALATGQEAIYFMYRNDARPINVDAGRTLRYLT